MLYTFLTETEGSTNVDQYDGSDVGEALRKWNRRSRLRPGFSEGQLFDQGRGGPTPIKGRKATWCYSGTNASGQFFLVHIVATAVPNVRASHSPRTRKKDG